MDQQHQAFPETQKSYSSDFGTSLETFPIQNQIFKRWFWLLFGILVTLIAISLSLNQLSTILTTVRIHGRAVILIHAPYLLFLFFTILPIGLIILVETFLHWSNRLILFEKGLVVYQGARKRKWHWQSTTLLDTRITHIRFGGSIIDTRIKFVLGNQKETLKITDRYKSMENLIQRVRSLLLPILSEWAVNHSNNDGPVRFSNDLSLSENGLMIKDTEISWDVLASPEIKNQRLYLYELISHNKIYQRKIKKIKNLDLLIYLLNNSR